MFKETWKITNGNLNGVTYVRLNSTERYVGYQQYSPFDAQIIAIDEVYREPVDIMKMCKQYLQDYRVMAAEDAETKDILECLRKDISARINYHELNDREIVEIESFFDKFLKIRDDGSLLISKERF